MAKAVGSQPHSIGVCYRNAISAVAIFSAASKGAFPAPLSHSFNVSIGPNSRSKAGIWGRLRERAKSYAKALANDILR